MGSQCGCSQNSLGRDFSETPRPSPHTHTSELTHSAMADHAKVVLAHIAHTQVYSLIHTYTYFCHMLNDTCVAFCFLFLSVFLECFL